MSPQRRIQDGGPSVSQAYALTRSSPSLLFLRTGLFPPTIALARLCRFAFCQLASGQLRLVPRIETYPRIVAFAQTLFGRALLLLVFATLLIPSGRSWQLLALGAAACAYAGRYRRWALLATTLFMLCLSPQWFLFLGPAAELSGDALPSFLFHGPVYALLALAFGLFAAAIYCTSRFRGLVAFRRPVLSMHVLLMALVVLAASDTLNESALVILWSLILVLCGYFWFLAYALRDQSAKDRWPILAQLGTFHPFWGTSATPYGKGAAYLRKTEATNPQDLAVTQLKGIKLFIWAYFLQGFSVVFMTCVHDYLQIPSFEDAFSQQMTGAPYPWYTCWGAVVSAFFEAMILMAATGHIIIACARMAGFRLLRNTCRPLGARSVAEFWNRYYYYFKELLVEFYYYPTFLRCFKRHKRLRLFFATFMAAGVGNAFYHFIRDIQYVKVMGLVDAIVGYQTYLFYCLLLSVGIGISQLRPQRARAEENWFHRTVVAPATVTGFYCLLLIFNDDRREYSLAQHFVFLFHLFGVDQWI